MRSLLFLIVVLAGCASTQTAPPPSRTEAASQPVALVVSGIDAEQYQLFAGRTERRATSHAENATELWTEGAAHFGVTLTDARTVIEADSSLAGPLREVLRWSMRAPRGSSVPAEMRGVVQRASAIAGAPRLLFVSSTLRDLRSGPLGMQGYRPGGDATTFNARVLDAPTGTLVAAAGAGDNVDVDRASNVEAVLKAAIFGLFSGFDADPVLFRARTLPDHNAQLHRYDGTTRRGRIRRVDGYTLVLADSTRVPLETLLRITTETAGNQIRYRVR